MLVYSQGSVTLLDSRAQIHHLVAGCTGLASKATAKGGYDTLQLDKSPGEPPPTSTTEPRAGLIVATGVSSMKAYGCERKLNAYHIKEK